MFGALLSRALHQERRYTVFVLGHIFLWLVVTPVLVSFLEGWSWTASLYFSVQSGLAIGFGALHVQQEASITERTNRLAPQAKSSQQKTTTPQKSDTKHICTHACTH